MKKLILIVSGDEQPNTNIALDLQKYITLLDIGKVVVVNKMHNVDEYTIEDNDIIIVRNCTNLDDVENLDTRKLITYIISTAEHKSLAKEIAERVNVSSYLEVNDDTKKEMLIDFID